MIVDWRGLEGASIVETVAMREALAAASYAVPAGEGIALHGGAGVGKTTTIHAIIAQHPERVCHRIAISARAPTEKEVTSAIARAVTGTRQNGNLGELTELVLERLPERRRLLVIDEAQEWGKAGLETMRFLHDQVWERLAETGEGYPFACVYAGGDGCWEKLTRYSMIESRITSWVEFAPLTTSEVLALIREFHPIYRDASDELLLLIDNEDTHGRLRAWVDFTKKALHLCQTTDSPLNERIVRNVFGWRKGGRRG